MNDQNQRNNNNRQGQGQNRPQQGGNNNNRNHHRRRHHHNRRKFNNKPMTPSLEKLYEKYLNLLEQHVNARRKFHDLYYRADDQQLNKLERNFYQTLEELRRFEQGLAPDLKEQFEARNNGLEVDLTYSQNHQLEPRGEEVPTVGEFEDPHFLMTQKNCDYEEDKDESVGTLDDYKRYKGLL